MRVLHVDSGASSRGGQRQLALLARAQARDATADVRVLAAAAGLLDRLRDAGVHSERWAGPSSPSGLAALVRALRSFRPDILHVHDSRAHGAARLLASGALQQRLVVHRRIDDAPRDRAATRWKYHRGTFVCVSRAVAGVLSGYGVPPERLAVVLSAVPLQPQPRPRTPVLPLRLMALGALVPHKGHDVLLEAMSLASSRPRLVLAGAGPLGPALRRQAAGLGLEDRVDFAGDVGDGARLLAACDLFVHPSRTEGLGTAVLDAMAASLPVLASRAGGLPEIVIPGENGWLVPPEDAPALASALDEIAALAASDPGELTRRGVAGRHRAASSHGVDSMVAGVRAVYDRLPEGCP